jgi:hypothetical protein
MISAFIIKIIFNLRAIHLQLRSHTHKKRSSISRHYTGTGITTGTAFIFRLLLFKAGS